MKKTALLLLLSCSTPNLPPVDGNGGSNTASNIGSGSPSKPHHCPVLKPLALSMASDMGNPCSLDLCDIYCYGFNEQPDTSLTITSTYSQAYTANCPTTTVFSNWQFLGFSSSGSNTITINGIQVFTQDSDAADNCTLTDTCYLSLPSYNFPNNIIISFTTNDSLQLNYWQLTYDCLPGE